MKTLNSTHDKEASLTCPECRIEGVASKLRCEGAWETDWYGTLTYYGCAICREHFVQQDDGDIELAAQ